MELFDWLSFIIRLAIVVPTVYIVVLMVMSLIRNRNFNGLTDTRLALFLLAVGVGLDSAIRLFGDFHVIFKGTVTVQQWLISVKWLLLASRFVLFLGITKFVSLFIEHEKHV